jgi:hypothetical protein
LFSLVLGVSARSRSFLVDVTYVTGAVAFARLHSELR